ncbi:hypothetical protein LTR56_027923 [Elasticomyces elasticus]|nr:hypothetical protein LTR56_027923 [Elasticomyces elasticus]
MSARYVSSTLIKKAMAKNGKTIAVECVDKTSTWARPTNFPSQSIKEDFTRVALENIDQFKAGTTTIAMKESEHQSGGDQRVHYTAYGLNDEMEVIDTQHLTKQKK